MKNMKVSAKLMISFIIVIAMSVLIGGFGIVGMMQINNASTKMYKQQTKPIAILGQIAEELQELRFLVREVYIGSMTQDMGKINDAEIRINELKEKIRENVDLYKETVYEEAVLSLMNDATRRLFDDYFKGVVVIIESAKKYETDTITTELPKAAPILSGILKDFDDLLQKKIIAAGDLSADNNKLFTFMLFAIIGVLVLAVAISLFLATYISKIISNPMVPLTAYMVKAGGTGDLSLTEIDTHNFKVNSQYTDEIGQLIKGVSAFVNRIVEVEEVLEKLSGGDFSIDIRLLSANDSMGSSVQKLINSMNDMFGEINSSSSQVDSGAKQIADGAQALSQGSTEQAASVEQLSSSVAEIAEQTKVNADMAEKAAQLSGDIRANAEKGSRQMDEMMEAVKDINAASQNISKVIKVIDDIAFQTNILALNAAVEAARAGQHGKGFAVVAEEVRNLAAKSAEAAKETGDMIQNSMEKAELGSRIASETAISFTEISEGIAESTRLVAEIAKSSKEQAMGISQVNIGIDQVAQVVQQNSATAEESAAASEEMSGQSAMLQELISQFKLK